MFSVGDVVKLKKEEADTRTFIVTKVEEERNQVSLYDIRHLAPYKNISIDNVKSYKKNHYALFLDIIGTDYIQNVRAALKLERIRFVFIKGERNDIGTFFVFSKDLDRSRSVVSTYYENLNKAAVS
jgi:hypothetical protein